MSSKNYTFATFQKQKTKKRLTKSTFYAIIKVGHKEYYAYHVVELDKNYLPGEEVNLKEKDIYDINYSECSFNE